MFFCHIHYTHKIPYQDLNDHMKVHENLYKIFTYLAMCCYIHSAGIAHVHHFSSCFMTPSDPFCTLLFCRT